MNRIHIRAGARHRWRAILHVTGNLLSESFGSFVVEHRQRIPSSPDAQESAELVTGVAAAAAWSDTAAAASRPAVVIAVVVGVVIVVIVGRSTLHRLPPRPSRLP